MFSTDIIVAILILIIVFVVLNRRLAATTITQPTLESASRLIKKFKLNPDVVSSEMLRAGMAVEMEHQKGWFNVVKGDQTALAKIALAHIDEYNDYYARLSKMELEAKNYWKGKDVGSIFL